MAGLWSKLRHLLTEIYLNLLFNQECREGDEGTKGEDYGRKGARAKYTEGIVSL